MPSALYNYSPIPMLVYFQHSPEHFLEVKLESYNTRFFHIKEDFAFTEVAFIS